jgi:HK97 family phage prohead protease
MDRALLATEMRLAGTPGEDRTMDVVASTEALDSHGTVLDSASWKLERFAANPVVLYAHDQRELPVGYAEDVRVEGGELRARLRFVTAAANPLAEQVWQLVRQKALRAVSVGFFAGASKTEKRGGREVAVLSDNELLEISVVPVPSNPEAVARLRARALDASPHGDPMTKKIATPDAAVDETTPAPDAAADHAVEVLETKVRALELELGRDAGLRENAERAMREATDRATDAEARATAAEDRLAETAAEVDALRARLGAAERLALLAEARSVGKLSPAHLDPSTLVGEFVASLTTAQLRGYLETKAREPSRAEPVRAPARLHAKSFDAMTPSQQADLYLNDRATYDALKAAAGQ